MSKYELLSPAGSFEALKAAVSSGADAVYIGGRSLSARSGAKNFSAEEISEAAAYCHERGARLHLAINTLVRPGEEPQVEKAVAAAAEAGVDALIIQDLGAAKIAAEVCPTLERHASTQLTAHSAGDVSALSELGFARVVLSRELSRGEIEEIHRCTGCELEAFVHGALCVCFSGQCLMSSFIGGRSGNRGSCAQPCRRQYFAEGRRGYFLSPRDLSLVKRIDGMKSAGITSFKIEGRMKSPEYVAVVTRIYRKALDGLPITEGDEADLRGIFARGGEFTEAYFSGINTPEMMNYDISNDNISSSAPKELIMRTNELLRSEAPRVGVRAELICLNNQPLRLKLSDGVHSVSAEGAPPSQAKNAPLTKEGLCERLAKTGGTPYRLDSADIHLNEGLFASASELNALRRSCFDELSRLRRIAPKREIYRFSPEFPPKYRVKEQRLFAQIRSLAQLKAAESADKVIIPLSLTEGLEMKPSYAALLPRIILDAESVRRRLSLLPEGTEVYASSLGGLRLISEFDLTPVGDFGLNVSNSLAAAVLSERAAALTLSPELSFKEISEICARSPIPLELIGYGRQEVMVSRACIIRGVRGRCDCSTPLTLKDKTGAEFTVFGDSETHLNTVLNSLPTFIADRPSALRRCGAAAVRLCFTDETADEAEAVIKKYRFGGEASGSFTRGHFFGK